MSLEPLDTPDLQAVRKGSADSMAPCIHDPPRQSMPH